MKRQIEIIEAAQKDLRKLDNSVRQQVYRALAKVSQNPLPKKNGGYGEPLGNKGGYDLAGYMKIKLRDAGIRVVYRAVEMDGIMRIIVVGARDDEEVYRLAAKRIQEL